MKTSKLLNKQFLSIIAFTLFLGLNSYSEEQPVGIWNLDKKKIKELFNYMIPNFGHKETGKYLDNKM